LLEQAPETDIHFVREATEHYLSAQTIDSLGAAEINFCGLARTAFLRGTVEHSDKQNSQRKKMIKKPCPFQATRQNLIKKLRALALSGVEIPWNTESLVRRIFEVLQSVCDDDRRPQESELTIKIQSEGGP
jgi:hypothetical protein